MSGAARLPSWNLPGESHARLDSAAPFRPQNPLAAFTMGQQTNKHIKKKRRIAYHKRRKARQKAAAKAKK
ncbi:MAG TPA: hypothetical protein VG936_02370 [Lacunisphaera sp.]|nr:hypothetical protein [Lacunisphaera sp.]